MDYATLESFVGRPDVVRNLIEAILGTSSVAHQGYSISITRLNCADPTQVVPTAGYALLLRMSTSAAYEELREVTIDSRTVPVVVRGGFLAPMPCS